MLPKVSVVILSYNHSKYISNAVDSVLNQNVTFQFEIIIADDNSTDGTPEIIKDYKERYPDLIRPILRKENIGTSRNICDAFSKCKGEYLTGFGGDDFWTDHKKLQIQAKWLDEHPDYVGVCHVIEARNDEGVVLGSTPNKMIRGKQASVNLFLKSIYYPTSSTLFRNIFSGNQAISYVNLITKSRLVEDVSLAMLLLDIGKVFVLDRCMSVYRSNNNKENQNYNSLRNPLQTLCDHIEVYKANDEFFRGRYDFSVLYASKAMYAFVWSIKNGKFRQFLFFFNMMPFKARVKTLAGFPFFVIKALRFNK